MPHRCTLILILKSWQNGNDDPSSLFSFLLTRLPDRIFYLKKIPRPHSGPLHGYVLRHRAGRFLDYYRGGFRSFDKNFISIHTLKTRSQIIFIDIVWLSGFIFLTKIIYTLARSHPFGEWDAWALWNMKTKFLILGAGSWENVFQLHWHTQPDYPLFMPFLNVWVHAFSRAPLEEIAIATAVLFTVLNGALLLAGLKQYIPPLVAGLASFILI